MNKYGQINFFCAGVCFMAIIAFIIVGGNTWICMLNLLACFLNVWMGYFITKKEQEKLK